MGIVEIRGGSVTVRFEKGKEVRIKDLKKPPEGTIQSLLPLLEELKASFPDILGEQKDWVELKEKAPLSPEESVNLLRRHGFSVDQVTDLVLKRMLTLSGVAGADKEKALEAARDPFKGIIERLYQETVEVRGVKK